MVFLGITSPMVKVEMVLSAETWHTPPHNFYTLEYLHQGESKIWYSVPFRNKDSFLEVMKAELNGEMDDMKDHMVRTLQWGLLSVMVFTFKNADIYWTLIFLLPRFLIHHWPSLESRFIK